MTTSQRTRQAARAALETAVNILLVDDDPTKRFALKTVLAPLGETIVEASSGADALRPASGDPRRGGRAGLRKTEEVPDLATFVSNLRG